MAYWFSHKPRQVKYQTKRRSWTQSFMHKKLCWVVLLLVFVVFTSTFQESECFIAETITLALPTLGSYMSSTAVAGFAAAGIASAAAIGVALGKLAQRAKPLISALSRLAPLAQEITDEDIEKFQELLDSEALDQLQQIQPEEIEQLRNAVQSGQLEQLSQLTPEQIEQFISFSELDIDPEALQSLGDVDPSRLEALNNLDPAVVESLSALEPSEIQRLQSLSDVDPAIVNSLGDLNPEVVKELSALDPKVIQQLGELDVESLKRLENISNSLGDGAGGGFDPSLLLLLGGGGDGGSNSSGGSSATGDKPIEVDPKLLRQLVASGQISQEVADMLIKSGSNTNTGTKGIDPRLIKALQSNPDLIKQLQGPDGKIDPDLIKQFTEDGNELSDDQLKVLETGTLPPELADVPPNILRDTGFFDGLPEAIQIQLGVLDPNKKTQTLNNKDKDKKKNEKLRKPKVNESPNGNNKPKKSRLDAIKLGILKRVNRTRTLPPKLRKVPKPVLKETGLFDKLPTDLLKELGLLDPNSNSKSSSDKNVKAGNIKTSLPRSSSQLRRRIDNNSYSVPRRPLREKVVKNIFLDKLNPHRILQSARNAARNTKNIVANMLYSQYNKMRRIGVRSYSGLRRMLRPKMSRRKSLLSLLDFSQIKLPPLIEIVSPNEDKYKDKYNSKHKYQNHHRKWRSLRSKPTNASPVSNIKSPVSNLEHHLIRRQVGMSTENGDIKDVSKLNVIVKDSVNFFENRFSDNISSDQEDLRAISLEPIFKEIEYLDSKYDCGKLYVCELGVGGKELSKDEQVLLSLLQDNHGISIASSKGPFDMAALLGRVTKNIESCRSRYNRCDIASIHYKNHPFTTK